jgi:hypothetical protein
MWISPAFVSSGNIASRPTSRCSWLSSFCDGMQIYLSKYKGDCQVGGLVHFVIEDVGAWHREFRARWVQPTSEPNNDLGFLNMTVTNPDGNQLRFMEPSTKTA